MDKKEAIEYLKDRMNDMPALAKLKYNNTQYPLWIKTIRGVIEKVFGRESYEYQKLAEVYRISGSFQEVLQNSYLRNLQRRATDILSIIQTWETLGFETEMKEGSEPIKAFIAHEGETRALTMLKEFLEALGIECFIAEAEASNGRSIERQVDWTQSKADFAIRLATKGKAINKKTGRYYMGLNVADELGRARQIYKNRIILLVQKGVEIHTNPREIVHESFTSTNMEKPFIKIVKQLRAWGFINIGILKENLH